MLITALVGFAACADENRHPLDPEHALASASSSADPDQAALSELTRVVAVALSDQGLRQRVKNDMRASRFTSEHKLPFTDYLHGSSGGILLAKMAKESGQSRAEILSLLDRAPALEFYMPVPEHRETWTGGAPLLIAGTLGEGEALVSYNLDGEEVPLSREAPPEVPTLVLVPVETDFTEPLNSAEFANSEGDGGQAIGTYAPARPLSYVAPDPCDPEAISCGGGGGGGGSTPPSYPSGIYMEQMTIYDNGEAWVRDDPELEVHMFGTIRGLYQDVAGI